VCNKQEIYMQEPELSFRSKTSHFATSQPNMTILRHLTSLGSSAHAGGTKRPIPKEQSFFVWKNRPNPQSFGSVLLAQIYAERVACHFQEKGHV